MEVCLFLCSVVRKLGPTQKHITPLFFLPALVSTVARRVKVCASIAT